MTCHQTYHTIYESEIKCQDYPRYYVYHNTSKGSHHFGINVCKVYNENDNFLQWLVVSNRMKRLIARQLVDENINLNNYGFRLDYCRWRVSQQHNELFKKLEKIQALSFEQLVCERELEEAIESLGYSQKELNNAKADLINDQIELQEITKKCNEHNYSVSIEWYKNKEYSASDSELAESWVEALDNVCIAKYTVKKLLKNHEEAKKNLELIRQKMFELNNIKCLKDEEDYDWNEFMI